MMRRILVRADDLGYCEAVNYGIAKSVNEGIVTSVGVMSNMPAVRHGLDLLKNNKVCLGLHTNICAGKPLTDPRLIPSLVNEQGEFKSSREYRSADQDFVVLEEVMLEIEAQYHQFVALTNQKPAYFEGHAVKSANFFKGLELVAKKYDLKYSGMPEFGEAMMVGESKVYMWMESMLPDYDPKQTMRKMLDHAHEDGVDVLVLHPGYLDEYILKHSSLTYPRCLEVSMACDEEVKSWLECDDIQLMTYHEV